jgi:hypothetical protein
MREKTVFAKKDVYGQPKLEYVSALRRKMKKTTAILLGTLIASSAALAQEPVLSRNAVGYVKVETVPDEFFMVRNDFLPMSGDPIPSVVLGEGLPVGTQVYSFDSASQTYNISTLQESFDFVNFVTVTNWSDDTLDLSAGKGFWIKPGSTTSSNVFVYFMGEVPSDSSATNLLQPGFNLVGFNYPVSIAWTSTALASSADLGDQIYTFSGGNYTISTYQESFDFISFTTVTNWSDTNINLEPGQAFWYYSTTQKSVNEAKPYPWP